MAMKYTPATPRSPDRGGLPPPLALDLTDMDRKIGWIDGDVIGFRGFDSEMEAAHGAWVAYRGLSRRLAQGSRRRPIPVDTEPLTLGRRGDADVVFASGRPFATLLRPGVGRLSDDASFAFELRVPAPTYESRVRAMAYVVYRELRKSGVRWGMWARDARRSARARAAREAPTPSATRREAAFHPVPNKSTPGFGWGLALLVLFPMLALGFVVPREIVVFGAIAAFVAVSVAGFLELPRRWLERRPRAPSHRRQPIRVSVRAPASGDASCSARSSA